MDKVEKFIGTTLGNPDGSNFANWWKVRTNKMEYLKLKEVKTQTTFIIAEIWKYM